MSRLAPLPRIMLAPTGARRSPADHPALPVTIPEIVSDARKAFEAGAEALHAHVRDTDGGHVLDAGLYRELIAEMARAVPDMPVQITTEAVGRYTPEAQRSLVEAVEPEGVSVALREMCPGLEPDREARRFYSETAEAGIALQHILYTPEEAARLAELVEAFALPASGQMLFVLGSYEPPRLALPSDLDGFLAAARPLANGFEWAACAFGHHERSCLLRALGEGGCARIGFENNTERPDGTPARDNAEQVAGLMQALAVDKA